MPNKWFFLLKYLSPVCFWENQTKTFHIPFPASSAAPRLGELSRRHWFSPAGSAFLSPHTSFTNFLHLLLPPSGLGPGCQLESCPLGPYLPSYGFPLLRSICPSGRNLQYLLGPLTLLVSCGQCSHNFRVSSSFFPSHKLKDLAQTGGESVA